MDRSGVVQVAAPAAEVQAGKGVPRTLKGRRTREALLEAARQVFARDGFFAAKVTDMTSGAGLANGTFYTYFSSKEEIFREVAAAALDQSTATVRSDPKNTERDPVRDILWANRHYLMRYRQQVGLMRAIEQATPHDAYIRDLRHAHFLIAVDRTERRVRSLQQAGLA